MFDDWFMNKAKENGAGLATCTVSGICEPSLLLKGTEGGLGGDVILGN